MIPLSSYLHYKIPAIPPYNACSNALYHAMYDPLKMKMKGNKECARAMGEACPCDRRSAQCDERMKFRAMSVCCPIMCIKWNGDPMV